MRDIDTRSISQAVEKMCIESNCYLNDDIMQKLESGLAEESSKEGKAVFKRIIQNAEIARDKKMAICQDTGMVVVFVQMGQDVHIIGGSLNDAINEGVRQGYKKGYLRNSVVADPIERINTNDNTPAVIYYEIVEGDVFKLSLAPKGFGSENMGAIKMLKPSDGIEGVKQFILDTVDKSGPNACPPIVVGVGIGGTMDKAAVLAKKALLRPINQYNSIQYVSDLEKEILLKINELGIGPAGFGGKITTLGVNIEVYPTHIAGLPVAVNLSCHVTRHAEVTL